MSSVPPSSLFAVAVARCPLPDYSALAVGRFERGDTLHARVLIGPFGWRCFYSCLLFCSFVLPGPLAVWVEPYITTHHHHHHHCQGVDNINERNRNDANVLKASTFLITKLLMFFMRLLASSLFLSLFFFFSSSSPLLLLSSSSTCTPNISSSQALFSSLSRFPPLLYFFCSLILKIPHILIVFSHPLIFRTAS